MVIIPRLPDEDGKPQEVAFKNPSKTTTIITIVVSLVFVLLYIIGIVVMLYFYFTEDSSPSPIQLKHVGKGSGSDVGKSPGSPSASSDSSGGTPSPPPQGPPPRQQEDMDITDLPSHEERRGSHGTPTSHIEIYNEEEKQHKHNEDFDSSQQQPTEESLIPEKKSASRFRHGRKRSGTLEGTESNRFLTGINDEHINHNPQHPSFRLKKQASNFSFDNENAPHVAVAEAV